MPVWLIFILVGATAVAVTIALVTVPHFRRLWGRQYYGGPTGRPRVAITFDDGPTPGGTDAVLDVLARAGVRATFFVVGKNAERHPDLLRRLHDEGHLIANHSYAHSHYGFLRGPRYWRREIDGTDEVVSRITGVRPAMFRPPMGFVSPFITAAVRRSGHRVMIWTRRGMDGVRTTPSRILERLRDLSPGDVITLHDGVEPNSTRDVSPTVQALPDLIRRIRDLGLEPVRLDELHGVGQTSSNPYEHPNAIR